MSNEEWKSKLKENWHQADESARAYIDSLTDEEIATFGRMSAERGWTRMLCMKPNDQLSSDANLRHLRRRYETEILKKEN